MNGRPPDDWPFSGKAASVHPLEANVGQPDDPHDGTWEACHPDPIHPGDDDVNPYATYPYDGHDLSQCWIHSGWQGDRLRIAVALAEAGIGLGEQTRFTACGSRAWVQRSQERPNVYRISATWCNSRWCRVCGRRRAARIAARALELVTPATTRFVTLTLKHSSLPLAKQIDRITRCFRRLRQCKPWADTQKGGIGFLEISKSKDGQAWHVHLHVLTDGRFMPQPLLAAAWERITGDSRIVDIRYVHSVRNAIKYLIKYIAKPIPQQVVGNKADLIELVRVLHGRRQYCVFGDWRGPLREEHEDGEVWETIGPLSLFLDRAAHGDLDAAEILESLRPWKPNRGTGPSPPDADPWSGFDWLDLD